MEPVKEIIILILPLIGVAIGAGLQFVFSRSSESRKHLISLRTQAYIDYISCVAESSKIGRSHKQFSKLLAEAANAKTRITIYGSSDAIQALSEFEKGKPVIDSPESANRFLHLVSIMRSENLGKRGIINKDDLKLILFVIMSGKSLTANAYIDLPNIYVPSKAGNISDIHNFQNSPMNNS